MRSIIAISDSFRQFWSYRTLSFRPILSPVMSVQTPISTICSPVSAGALILKPAPSRLLLAWRLASHSVAIAGVLSLPLGAMTHVGLIVAILIHARLRRAVRVGTIIVTADGDWALPELRLTNLRPSATTRYSGGWVDLRLHGETGEEAVLLLYDQLGREDWCRLQARLRRLRADSRLP